VNQLTGEVVANGSAKIQTGSDPAVEIESVSENGWIKYDTATATNGAVLRRGDQIVRADKVIVNGHNTISASGNPTPQLAQNQPSVIHPTRTMHTSSGFRAILKDALGLLGIHALEEI